MARESQAKAHLENLKLNMSIHFNLHRMRQCIRKICFKKETNFSPLEGYDTPNY